MTLLAQASGDALGEIGKKISEGVSEGVAEGLAKSSEHAPTNWILMFATVAIVMIFCTFIAWALKKVLDVLQAINDAQDARDAANRAHVKEMSSDFTQRDKEGRVECHTHSKELAQLHKEAAANIALASGRLEGVAEKMEESAASVAKTVHDNKNVQQSVLHTLDLVLAHVGKPLVSQNFQAPLEVRSDSGT